MISNLRRTLSFFMGLLLFVALVACHATPTRESTGEYIDDSAITTKVKTALFSDKEISSSSVSVETFKGSVQLSGFVSNPEEVRHAGEVAAQVDGVKVVHNNLIVK